MVVERIADVEVKAGGGVSRCRVGRLLFICGEAGCRTGFLPIGHCPGVKVRPLELRSHSDIGALLFISFVAGVRWPERR